MVDKVVTQTTALRRAVISRVFNGDTEAIRFFENLVDDLTRVTAGAVNSNADELDGATTSIASLTAQIEDLTIRLSSAEHRAQSAELALQRIADLQTIVLGA